MTSPSSSYNVPPDFANLDAIYESLKNFEHLKKSAALPPQDDVKLSSFVSDIFEKFTANRKDLVQSSESSKEYRDRIAKIGASIRRLNPDIFNKNNGTNFFKNILAESRNIAGVKALPPRFEMSEINESKNIKDFTKLEMRDKPFDPTLFDAYKEKFQAAAGLQPSRMTKILSRFQYDEDLSYGTHLVAEYMQERGSPEHRSFTYVIDILKKMRPPQSELVSQLEHTHKHALATPKAIKNEIRQLKLGESMTISSSTSDKDGGHACLLTITLSKKDAANRNLYSLIQHNTGLGLDYHHSFTEINGRTQFQTALEIEDVSEERLLGSSTNFIENLVILDRAKVKSFIMRITSQEAIDQLYALLFSLNGTRLPPSKNPRLWQREQLGGSCEISRFRSFLRAQLSEQDYKQFKDLSRYEFLLQTFIKIKKQQGNIATQRHICLEVIGKVERRYRKYHKDPGSFD